MRGMAYRLKQDDLVESTTQLRAAAPVPPHTVAAAVAAAARGAATAAAAKAEPAEAGACGASCYSSSTTACGASCYSSSTTASTSATAGLWQQTMQPLAASLTCSLASVHNRYIVAKDGVMFCTLCGKTADWAHTSSPGHQSRHSEMAACDQFLGECLSNRRFSAGAGLPGPLTQANMAAYWGCRWTCMNAWLLRCLQEGKVLIAKTGKTRLEINIGNITRIEVGAILYNGSGKYNSASGPSPCVLFSDMPVDSTTCRQHNIPTGSYEKGWWPVCAEQRRGTSSNVEQRRAMSSNVEHHSSGHFLWFSMFAGVFLKLLEVFAVFCVLF